MSGVWPCCRPTQHSVELFQAAPEMELAELLERVARRMKPEEQLVISPAFFLALAERDLKLSHAEIRLKRERSDNEMIRFRYDVVFARSQRRERQHRTGMAGLGSRRRRDRRYSTNT
jgi:hypothetical protein